MLVDQYVNALLVDPVSADEVWELWDAGVITDEMAALAWLGCLFPESPIVSVN